MKTVLITLSLLLTSYSFAGTAYVYTNDDESGLVIKGNPAETIYEKLDIQEEKPDVSLEVYYKRGKDIDCTKDATNSTKVNYSCLLAIVEVEGSGGLKFTGEVGSK